MVDQKVTESKRRRRAIVIGAVLPLAMIMLASLVLSRCAGDLGAGGRLEQKRSEPPHCGDVLVFTSQRHGSNTFMESINNCRTAAGHRYTRTFEFPDYSMERILRQNLSTYDSFYDYLKTQPSYSYKIMSTVFYQFYYHVDKLIDRLAAERKHCYVLLRRNNSLEVFYSHADHLRQTRMPENRLTGAEFSFNDVTVAGRKRDSFYVPRWSHDEYERYRGYVQRFYDDIQTFASQKRIALDEVAYEDVIVKPPSGPAGRSVLLPNSNCVLRLCARDTSTLEFVNERA
jgi:hypothetical protein